MENEVLKAIKERRSIRRYKADQITDEELKAVLEAGTWAATGHGTQEPFIIAVQNPETCAQLRKMNAEVMGVESILTMEHQPSSSFWLQRAMRTPSRTAVSSSAI